MKSAAFIGKIKDRFESIDKNAERKCPGVFQFDIVADTETKSVFIDLKNLKVTYDTCDLPIDAVISISDDDFYLMGTKELSGKLAYEQGKIKITGNLELAHKMFSLASEIKK